MDAMRQMIFVLVGLGLLVEGSAEPLVMGLRSDRASDRIRGSVLISELGCANCHHDLATRFSPRSGSQLSSIGNRMDFNALRALLSNPSSAHPGTTMPDVLGGLTPEERSASVNSLAHFLSAQRTPAQDGYGSLSDDADRGQELFASIGCVACHARGDGDRVYEGIAPLGGRYALNSLAKFLRNPYATRPASRMPDLHLNHQDALDLAAHLLAGSTSSLEPLVVQPQQVARGARLFQDLSCIACHQVDATDSDSDSLAPGIVDTSAGCLSPKSGKGAFYDLSESQRTAIQAALTSPGELTETEAIEVGLRQFNCIACHERDGYGGPSEELIDNFSGADLNLGDAGRLPPKLTGVGAKLNSAWLRRVVVEGADSRPYLHTRMPRFQGTEIDSLLERFGKVDQLEPVQDVTFSKLNEAKRVGRDLAGSEGLSCITCHTVKGAKVGAMGAVDLNLLGQRLTREWFHHYLRSPVRFSPNTLMPAFWPDGVSSRPEVLGGDVNQQIEALWLYLSDGFGIGTPRGVGREPMQLLASEGEAVMLRRSYRGVGKRGIGVGYPSQVNLVYDAEQMCLVQLWSGPFLDPSGVWLSQGHGTARPLGKDVISFGGSPDLGLPSEIGNPRVVTGERNPERQFLGYTLDRQRRPTFEYRFRDAQVSDSFLDFRSGKTVGLRRTMKLDARAGDRPYVLSVARGDAIRTLLKQEYEIDGRIRVEVEMGAGSIQPVGENQQALQVVPIWRDGIGHIIVSYRLPL